MERGVCSWSRTINSLQFWGRKIPTWSEKRNENVDPNDVLMIRSVDALHCPWAIVRKRQPLCTSHMPRTLTFSAFVDPGGCRRLHFLRRVLCCVGYSKVCLEIRERFDYRWILWNKLRKCNKITGRGIASPRVAVTVIRKKFDVCTSLCRNILFQVIHWANVFSRRRGGIIEDHNAWISVEYVAMFEPGISRVRYKTVFFDTARLHQT